MANSISSADEVSQLLLKYPQLLPHFLRLGFRPGFGDCSLEQLCASSSVPAPLLVFLVNILLENPVTMRAGRLSPYALLPLMSYLKASHTDLGQRLLLAVRHIDILLKGMEPANTKLSDSVSSFLSCLSSAVSSVIDDGQQTLFPQISRLYEVYFSPQCTTTLGEVDYDDLIRSFTGSYSSAALQIIDLQNLFMRYMQGNYNDLAFCGALRFLTDLQNDLVGLLNVQKKLLKPMVLAMNRAVIRRSADKSTPSRD